jgi:hypothetical protein
VRTETTPVALGLIVTAGTNYLNGGGHAGSADIRVIVHAGTYDERSRR